MKRIYLYLIISVLFIGTFVGINMKYDRFYRVNGINNDNLALIEKYLDDDEQDYLISNGIAVDQFIDYIEIDNFELQNYEYYNLLKQSGQYTSNDIIVKDGNILADKLTSAYTTRALKQAKKLVKNKLVEAYIEQESFNFDYLDDYQQMRTLYDGTEYVPATNKYISILKKLGYKNTSQAISKLSSNYDQDGISLLLDEKHEDMKLVLDPSNLLTIVNDENYIANYVPKDLSIADSIPRTDYSMYIEKNTYEALKEMYADAKDECKTSLLLYESYESYTTLERNNLGGKDERQLGTCIKIKAQNYAIKDFEATDLYQWLVDHCYQYGFIQRYPEGKKDITGNDDITVFRYVGKENAKAMHDAKQCLEEYIKNAD